MKILIIGGGPQALFLLRLYSCLTCDIELASIGNKVATYSNIPKKNWKFKKITDLDFFIEKNIEFYDLVSFAGGFEIQGILESSPAIFDRDNVQPSSYESLKIFSSKEHTYDLSKSENINVLGSFSIKKLENNEIPFSGPYILKWDKENLDINYGHFKTKVFNDAESLGNYVRSFDATAQEKLIVQKYLKTTYGSNVSYLGYYHNGRHVFGFLGQQLLQYPLGITAHLKEYKGIHFQSLIDSSVAMVESNNFNGFCEVEYIQDTEDGKFYILEVNPRPCGWASALLGKFDNLPELVFNKHNDILIKDENVEWINILRYLRVSWDLGRLAFLKAVLRVPFIKCYDVYSIRDLKPFISQFFFWK